MDELEDAPAPRRWPARRWVPAVAVLGAVGAVTALALVRAVNPGGTAAAASPASSTPATVVSTTQPSTSAEPFGLPTSSPGGECPAGAPVGHLPTGTPTVDAAYECDREARTEPDGSVRAYLVVRRVTGGLPALLDAYAGPDAPRSDGPCSAVGYVARSVWLHLAGGTVVGVRWPVGPCGEPDQAGSAALAALTTTVVSSTPGEVLQPAPYEPALGCPQGLKDPISAGNQSMRVPAAGVHPRVLAPADHVLCVYASGTGGPEQVGDGWLVGARMLSARQWQQVDDELARAHPDPTCVRDPRGRFAAWSAGSPDRMTVVALDGCAVVQDWSYAWRAPAQLRALLR